MSDPKKKAPNVLVVLADDMGWGDLSVHGNRNLQTPHIDSLARDGTELLRFFVSPVCSPTRAEFLTGRYHQRCGCLSVTHGRDRMNAHERTIAEDFQAAGYATGLFGKWHNGTQGAHHPLARGFDEFMGFTCGHLATLYDVPVEENGERIQPEGYIPDIFTEQAMDFMERQSGENQPFFCFVPLNTPHEPLQVEERFFETVVPEAELMRSTHPEKERPTHTRAALAMCANLDWNVGRLLGKLESLGIAEDTLVIYFSDHGPNGWRWNGGFEGAKASVDEGGVRSPCFMRWPGTIPPSSRVEPICGAIDLRPTLAGLLGFPEPRGPDGADLDGTSLEPLLRGEASEAWPDREIIAHFNGKVSVRSERFRLTQAGALFDVEADPGQTRDLTDDFPGQAEHLRGILESWVREFPPDDVEMDPRPLTLGHPQVPMDSLTTEHGNPYGNIRRNSRWASSSWFENWISEEDSIVWNLEVLTAGRYAVELLYVCPEGETGSTVELSFKNARLSRTLTEPHDPPLLGEAEDRFPRKVSFHRNFKAWPLGVMDLPATSGPLTLRATHIPGNQVLDVSSLIFRRL